MKSQIKLSKPEYRADIDGLRAVAVLSVVLYHSFPGYLKGGFIGVDIFFVISGYLISIILFESFNKGNFSFSEFYSHRIRRIFPAVIVVLIASIIFGWFALLSDEYKQLGKHITSSSSFVLNLVYLNETSYFSASAEKKPLLHLWSLGVEAQFYILWPIILYFFSKLRFNLFLTTLVIMLGSFIVNLLSIKVDPDTTFYSPHTRMWEFLFGSLLAYTFLFKRELISHFINRIYIFNKYNEYNQHVNKIKKLADISSSVGLFLLIFGFFKINKDLNFPGIWAIIPVLGTILIIASGSKAWINQKILSNKILVWIGLISYPLYLWHWPLLSFARIIDGEMPNVSVRLVIIFLAFILAFLTFHLVERPIRNCSYIKRKSITLLVLMSLIGAMGYIINANDGYESRNSIKGLVNNKDELIRAKAVDDECLKYINMVSPLFPYCRFSNVNSSETVAIIGDSHAHVAFPGISKFLSEKGINTLLMANSSCPPFIGVYTGSNKKEQEACRDRVEQLLGIVSEKKDIRKVFIFTRGPIYNTGTQPSTGEKIIINKTFPIDDFALAAQLTFNRLKINGKILYYITENPELNYPPSVCLSRPLSPVVKDCVLEKNAVLRRQADYIKAFISLNNVTIIDSMNIFCPDTNCIVFNENGSLLYADSNHLSLAGSDFQVDKLLRKFLD